MVPLLPAERQVEVFTQLSEVRLGNWTAPEVTALPDVGAGPPVLLPAEDSRNGAEYVEVRVPVGAAAEWVALYRAAVGVMGYEAPMLGGSPQLWARWRRPGTPEAGDPIGTTVGLLLADDRVWVTLTGTETWEDHAYRTWEWGEGTGSAPYQWLAFQRHKSLSGMQTGGRVSRDWDDIAGGTARTFDSLLGAVDIFDAEATVRMTMQNRTITAFFDVTMRPGRVLEYSKAGAHGLDEYGWHVLDKRTWRCHWAAATSADCAAAADVLVRTMRDDWRLKVDEPEAGRYPGYCKTRFLGRSTMDLPGLGFPRSQDNR